MEKQLQAILETMEIPAQRKDCSKLENLLWLARNMGIQNRNHVEYSVAVHFLRNLLTQKGQNDVKII